MKYDLLDMQFVSYIIANLVMNHSKGGFIYITIALSWAFATSTGTAA